MLAIKARYKPCLALSDFSSEGLSTCTTPFSIFTLNPLLMACFNSPFVPLTVTLPLAKVQVTSLGRDTGSFPILDMTQSINTRNTILHHQPPTHELPYR